MSTARSDDGGSVLHGYLPKAVAPFSGYFLIMQHVLFRIDERARQPAKKWDLETIQAISCCGISIDKGPERGGDHTVSIGMHSKECDEAYINDE